ncbi:beta-galactosidase-1-like protein 3 [Sorex araneus]|uniref:beta-galactosidase-1-like protein 3 n=1 Tax=Sorex araneus TaxID=42254 RepID=UPI00243399F5|nr:beta-galactosidase-1-like protein 3 [Sorex araneus]
MRTEPFNTAGSRNPSSSSQRRLFVAGPCPAFAPVGGGQVVEEVQASEEAGTAVGSAALGLSLRTFICVLFLPFIFSGLAPRAKDSPAMRKTQEMTLQSRFNLSQLNPLDLRNRSVGLQAQKDSSAPHFTLEGQRFLILGGSIHYFRVPRDYWRDRLLKLKACGFNTVTTYVPWNLHEPERGAFNFSGNLDLQAFVLMAGEIGLWVILRPGPYICSEIDLGGLPSWLLRDRQMRLRSTYSGFLEAVTVYFNELIPMLVPLQYRRGGPVIALQVENEYGAFMTDNTYMAHLHQALVDRGIVELLLTSDNENDFIQGSIKGVLASINMHKLSKDLFQRVRMLQPDMPILVMEFWVGWFDTWGGNHATRNARDVVCAATEFLKYGISFNTYMFHGGTNFGFMNGGVSSSSHQSVVTSYDYDAVLTEAGDYTEKYYAFRRLFRTLGLSLPSLPAESAKARYPPVKPSLFLSLWDVLPYLEKPVLSKGPINMENLPINNGNGQAFGFTLYETTICSGGWLEAEVHDVAQVFLNQTYIGDLHDRAKELMLPDHKDCRRLRILVENQGRVSYSRKILTERKGIIGPVKVNKRPLVGFTIYSLEMKESFFNRLRTATWMSVPKKYVGPAFYLGTLHAGSSPRDSFLDLQSWNYGFVFINGHNLGRYWKIGPQKTLYLPGAWLNPEDNEIILFDKRESGLDIRTTENPSLGSSWDVPSPDSVHLDQAGTEYPEGLQYHHMEIESHPLCHL